MVSPINDEILGACAFRLSAGLEIQIQAQCSVLYLRTPDGHPFINYPVKAAEGFNRIAESAEPYLRW